MTSLSHWLRCKLSDTRGVSLIVTIGMVFALTLISFAATKLVIGFMMTAAQVERANIAFSIAEGGVEMALYEIVQHQAGYEDSQTVFDSFGDADDYGEWELFAKTLSAKSDSKHYVPNPYFVGDKDGDLEAGEWGRLTKGNPISLSLLTDDGTNPISDSQDKIMIFDPGSGWDPGNYGVDPDGAGFRDRGDQEVFAWTLSALESGTEYTLQGVVWESDFIYNCDGSGVTGGDCFIFDLDESAPLPGFGGSGNPYAGEDINENLPSRAASLATDFNRISASEEIFAYAGPQDFLDDINGAISADSARLTITLIGTLAEISRDPSVSSSNSLSWKLESDELWADEYTYVIAEGFADRVKQTIETHFRSESAIPIFSYVIFQ